MSWHYSRALVEAFWEENSSGGRRCVLLKMTPTVKRFSSHDRTTEVASLSRFGTMSGHLTDDRGEELLTWFQAGSHARTSARQEKALGSMANDPGSGVRWHELSVRFDPGSSSWKTHRCLWEEDLAASSVTLPRWGMMRGGVCWEDMRRDRPPTASVFGWSLPRLTAACGIRLNWGFGRDGNGRYSEMVKSATRKILGARPTLRNSEWLMGWPIGQTALEPLETDRFQQWLNSHGKR